MCYALIGIPLFLMCLARISIMMSSMFRFLYSAFLNCICCYCRIRSHQHKKRFVDREKQSNSYGIDYVGQMSIDPSWPEYYNNLNNHENDLDNKFDESWYRVKNRVPILVIISIIVGYLYLGAFMFHKFENWSLRESVYFCYIALSTIGFGDYVCKCGKQKGYFLFQFSFIN